LEIIISSIGALLSIALIAKISIAITGLQGAAMIVPAMGAAAVLVFAIPHGQLSQPWALFVGNLLSAVVGVACYQWIPNLFFAAGLAVGLAIVVMHLTRSLHPPGGATALVAVVGGQSIHDLGYQYVLTPILLNLLIIFTVAFVFNNFFHWRRYPASLKRFVSSVQQPSEHQVQQIDKQKIAEVIAEMDLVVDTSLDDLQYLMVRTLQKMDMGDFQITAFEVGCFYCNGQSGRQWAVREVLSLAPSKNPKHDMLMYCVVEGHQRGRFDSCTVTDFRAWAVKQVVLS
jgi:CBS-domain-containing membrane protein